MKNNQNLQIHNVYKILAFVFLFGLSVSGATKAYGQKLTEWDIEFADKVTCISPNLTKTFLNKIIAVNSSGILLRDCQTGRERIIETKNGGVYLCEPKGVISNFMFIPAKDVAKVFRPGDVVAIRIDAREIPGNCNPLTHKLKISAQNYYNQNNVFSGKALPGMIYPCVEIWVPDRKAYYINNVSKSNNARFNELKQNIQGR